MLKRVLDGERYDAIARASRVTRSAVEQRVKALARELQRVVGVEGVDEDDMPTAALLRSRKEGYLEALAHYRPDRLRARGDNAGTLSAEAVTRAVALTRQRSRCGSRDVALLHVLFSTGARPLEIARLDVRDYLAEDGSVREESLLPAKAAVNGKARPLFFVSAELVAAVDVYLDERKRRGYGTTTHATYRGLNPCSRLFLTDKGEPIPIRARPTARGTQYRCGVILDMYRRIFARAGMKGTSPLCARRTLAQRLSDRGCDVDQVGTLLGLADRASVRHLLRRERPSGKPLTVAMREIE